MPIHYGILLDKLVNTLIWEIDTKECESQYTELKIPEYSDWLDLEVRNTFHEGVREGILKCIMGYNYYGYRDDKINKGLVRKKCPRCS